MLQKKKIDIKEKNFIITNKCDESIKHINITYEKSILRMKNNKNNKILFN